MYKSFTYQFIQYLFGSNSYIIYFKRHKVYYKKNSKGNKIRSNQNEVFRIEFPEKPKSLEYIKEEVINHLGYLPKDLKIYDRSKKRFVLYTTGGIDW